MIKLWDSMKRSSISSFKKSLFWYICISTLACKVCKNRNFNQCSVICKTLKNNVYSLKKMSCNIIFLFRQQFNGNSNSNSFFHPSMVEVNTVIFYSIYFNFALIIMGKLCPISWICSIFRSWPMKINS